jgi:hypothetical protein
MFKKDNFFFGFMIALGVSLGIWGLFYLVSIPLHLMFNWFNVSKGTMITTGLSANLITINYYLNYKYNRTAKGIMVLFLLGAAYVVIEFFSD